MAVNSYQGVSSLQGVNSFGGGNDFQAPADSRNIQASQIQDTGLRSLLQDQFKPANSYSKLQVAPLGQVKSLADQYQTIDQSKLDDPTRQFLQPYLTGKTSSLDPTKSFISRGQLTSAQSAMEAQNAAQKADYERRLAEYNAQRAAQGQSIAPTPQGDDSRQKLIDDLYSKVTASTADWQSRYAPAKASIEKYAGYGFVPGQSKGDWQWMSYDPIQTPQQVDEQGVPYEVTPDPDNIYEKGSGRWLHSSGSPRGLTYSPSAGFWESDFDHKATGMGKIMPALTLGVLGAMTGGAGLALGGGAGTLGGIAGQAIGAALPSTMSTGLQTGDWGKALGTGAVSALGSGLAGAYGPTLGSSLGLEGQLAKSVSSGLIGGGVNSLGQMFQGKSASDALRSGLGGALTGAGGSYIGSQLGDLMGGGSLGGAAGKILGGTAGGGLNALLNKGDIGQALVSNLLGGTVSGGLGAAGNYLGGGSQLGSMLSGAGTSAAKAYANNELAKRLKRKSNV